ncbi:MAG: hypothetical protein AB8C46_16070 [Burkholderiaceae bacterium]
MRTPDSAERNASPWWPGCLLPGLSVGAVLLVLVVLAIIADLDTAIVPKPQFGDHVLSGYPDNIPFSEAGAIVDAGLRWLGLSFVQWVVGFVVIGLCLFEATKADTAADEPSGATRVVLTGIVVAILLLSGFIFWSNMPLMSFGPVVEMLGRVSDRWPMLASLSTAFALLAAWTVLLTISVLLDARSFGGDRADQIRAIQRIVVGAAILLVFWIVTATAMYRLSATLLQAPIREPLLKLAPTISLGGGLLMSMCLGAAYLSAIAWLRRLDLMHINAQQAAPNDNRSRIDEFIETQWVRVATIALPMLPGLVEMMAQTWLLGA